MTRVTSVLVAVGLLCAPGCKKKDEGQKEQAQATAPVEPAPTPEPAKPDPALVARGKYLTQVGGCPLCHTPMGPKGPEMDKLFAGGMEMKEAFGTWRSPNITQDEETGIGKWTDEQIIAAVRTGMRPDGTGLYPIMPYMFYGAMSDDDAKALVAYLRTVPAVSNKVERLTLPLPTADKLQQPPHDGKPPAADDPIAQGNYLATIAHCAMCHTPFDMKTMQPDMSKMFAGGMPFELPPQFGKGVVYSRNITSDEKTGIGKWTEADIAKAIKGMVRPDGKPIYFPMAAYAATWVNLTDDDAANIAKFIKSIPPISNKVPDSKYTPAPPPGAPPAGDDTPKKG